MFRSKIVGTQERVFNPDPPLPWSEEVTERVVVAPQPTRRTESLDLARGLAITLMIISHSIKGLLSYEQMPDWGIMPIHAITKFSSSIFFTVFGISLAIFIAPSAGTEKWPKRRNKLLVRALIILFWYKVLTVVQMIQTYPKQAIVEALMYERFPDFVEVLGFYGIFLLWFPFVLPLWKKTPLTLKIIVAAGWAYTGSILANHFDFWGSDAIRTILVEKPGEFTFGQFQRGAMVLFGWILGEHYLGLKDDENRDDRFALTLVLLSLVGVAYFLGRGDDHLIDFLTAIGKNYGKHPPTVIFTSYSLGGALAIIALCFYCRSWLPKLLKPIVWIGRWPLFSFGFHIAVVFGVYRWGFDFNQKVTYGEAWMLTLFLLALTSGITYFLGKRKGLA
ncbi:MAG: heparan-alpha-glucosaminide N-acetyltransferase domain-containing protein [Bdellovibrionales bacterium]